MEVAIKATRNMIDEKPDMARERILQEGRLFWLLKHENIIPLHGICLEEPNMCLIMEYARGGPLNRILVNIFMKMKKSITYNIVRYLYAFLK